MKMTKREKWLCVPIAIGIFIGIFVGQLIIETVEARDRYAPLFWRAITGGIELVSGNVTVTSGNLTLTSGTLTVTSGNLSMPSGNLAMVGNATITGALNYGADAQANDTYVVTITGLTGYVAGMFVTFDPNNDNTDACTLNINGLGAKSLKTVLGADPATSHIDAAQIVPLVYDGTNFVILTPDSNP